MKKAQTQIVSAIIIMGIAIVAIGSVYPWASSMIQKRKDAKTLDDAYNFFQRADETIRYIANNGGEETIELKNIPGLMTIFPDTTGEDKTNNYIEFKFLSKLTNIAPCNTTLFSPLDDECWVALNTPNANETGTLGIDTRSVILGYSEKVDNDIEIRYKLWYRALKDTSTDKSYKININTVDGNAKKSTSPTFRIQRSGTTQVGSLTITNITIILTGAENI